MFDIIQYSLSCESLDPELVMVTRLSGFESLSVGFAFGAELCPTSGDPLPFDELVGQTATLSFILPHGRERHVNGVLDEVVSLGHIEGRHRYWARLVPRLRLLDLNRRARIFQNQSTVDIVKKVLSEGEVELRAAVTGSYLPREYCVQYGESDGQFVRRLLEEEGIAFYFEHTADSHVMVLVDAMTSYPSSGCLLPFRGETGNVTAEEHVSQLNAARRLRPGKVTVRDFNYLVPDAKLTAEVSGEETSGDMERYEHPGDYAAQAGGRARAQVRLEEEQRDLAEHEAVSDCAGLLPGFSFTTVEHPVPALDGDYVVVRVTHDGDARRYTNRVLCVPADHPWRPPRTVPRPPAPGVQTAIVVGPAGEEIHTDEHGRIKVQFHWDREGQGDDNSSCWMRVSQNWAGPGFGALYLPRVGNEVLVAFVNGDIHQPVVVGSLYNGLARPPLSLPDEKTQSTLRSNSSPGGGGSNEIRTEDAAGSELVYVHAQKDETIAVENDKKQEVRDNEVLVVHKDRHREIHQNHTLTVSGDDTSTVEKNQTLTVQRKRTTETIANHIEKVAQNQSITVAGLHRLTVAQASGEDVGAAKALTVGGLLSIVAGEGVEQSVEGVRSQVATRHDEWIAADREETVRGDLKLTVGGKLVIDVHQGEMKLETEKDATGEVDGDETWEIKENSHSHGEKVEIKADELAFVVNGKKLLSMSKSGDFKLAAKTLIIDGQNIKAKGKTVDMVGPGSAPSGKAKKAKPEKLKAKGRKPVKGLTFNVSASPADPAAGLEFKATLPDGTVIEGHLTAEGGAAITGVESGDVKIELPELAPDEIQVSPEKTDADSGGSYTTDLGPRRNDVFLESERKRVSRPGDGKFVLGTDVAEADADDCGDVFTLKSTDGRYNDHKQVKSDKVIVDGLVQLIFAGLPRDARYTLTARHDAGEDLELFADIAFDELAVHAMSPAGGDADDDEDDATETST